MGTDVDYLGHLARESARFAAAVRQAPPDAPVPSCPDWNADDLLWHLTEVQLFWGTVVREKMTEAQVDGFKAERPADRAGLSALYERVSHELVEVLTTATPETPAWTWAPDKTVGFIRRRQAHEALIHRIDAELTAGARTAADPQLSADGVDEVLRVMYGGAPEWGTFTLDDEKTVRFLTSDTGGSWLATLGRFTGTDPADGTAHDIPDIRVAGTDPGTRAAASVSGSAADLDCWLWRRPTTGPIERTGDQRVLDSLESTIAAGIN